MQCLSLNLVSEESQMSRELIAILWVQAVINMIASLFDTQLILFHVWLAKKNITTFQYVMYKRELNIRKSWVKDGRLTEAEF